MAAAKERPSCSIRVLPPELVAHAARIATDINPLNRPAVAQFAATFPGDETDIVPAQYIAALTSKYWGAQPRVLPVTFMDNPDSETRRLILEHLNMWRCGVTFAESETMGKVRISRDRAGYWSYIGTDILLIPPDQPTLNLQGFTARTASAEYLRVVPHEGGHSMGFMHEHMTRALVERLDREKTVRYFGATQGWSRREVEAQVLTPLDESTLMATPADETSVMCYQLPGEITKDRRPIPGGDRPNATDLAFARSIYPFVESPTPPVTPPSPPPRPITPPDGVNAGLVAEVNSIRAARGCPPGHRPAPGGAGLRVGRRDRLPRPAHPRQFGARIAEVYPDRPSGEVIGAGQTSAAQVTGDWMTSPGHAKRLLGAYDLMGGATATAGDGTPYWVADFVRGAPVTSPPVEPEAPEPPTPDDGNGAVPIKINVASGPHAYRPANGPLVFRFVLKGVKEKNVMVRLEARGRWMMSLGPGNPPDSPYAETKKMTDRLAPGTYHLGVYRAARTAGSCRVKVAAATGGRP